MSDLGAWWDWEADDPLHVAALGAHVSDLGAWWDWEAVPDATSVLS